MDFTTALDLFMKGHQVSKLGWPAGTRLVLLDDVARIGFEWHGRQFKGAAVTVDDMKGEWRLGVAE
jgi:hypothetical protein